MSVPSLALRITIPGEAPIVLSEKEAAAVTISYLILTPTGRLATAGGLLALLFAGLIGHWMTCT